MIAPVSKFFVLRWVFFVYLTPFNRVKGVVIYVDIRQSI